MNHRKQTAASGRAGVPPTASITQTRVRYIKLGAKGGWEEDCLKRGVVRIGFGSGQKERFRMCNEGRWDDLKASFIAKGRTKGVATDFTNQMRHFYEDDGATLWITFVGQYLYWGALEATPPSQDPSGDGVCRTVIGGWRRNDLNGDVLTKDQLSGALNKLSSYQGTSCAVDVAEYVLRRVRGTKTPEVERALAAAKEMRDAALGLMKLLGPKDFELLVDLVFTNSGWRRIGVVGKTQKTLDLDLELPSTGERAFVQVKSKTSSSELAEYIAMFEEGPHDRMFFVFHSGEAETDNEDVTVIGPEKLADLVIDAGLTSWLIRRVS
jgi:hypothetical protein